MYLHLSHNKGFGYFSGIMAQFELVKLNLLNKITLRIYLCDFQITHRLK